MAYLISHLAICLAFAQVLGVLLGWLIWGFPSRQRGKEIQALRERIADMHLMAPRISSGDAGHNLSNPDSSLHDDDFPPLVPERTPAALNAIDPEVEVRSLRIKQLEQQLAEIQPSLGRLPKVEAELEDAIAGRKSIENRLAQTKADFETRSHALLSQIHDFENAAHEWDTKRDEFELAHIAKDKEITSLQARLLDIQNSQSPQPINPATEAELAETKKLYQAALKERDAIAAEFEAFKQRPIEPPADQAHLAELQEALHAKDAAHEQQITRIQSLLWRIAELEPFESDAARMEQDLRRQESEIAGHVAMHAETSAQIVKLRSRVEELEATTSSTEELQKQLAEKDTAISNHLQAQAEHSYALGTLQGRVSELENIARKVAPLEKTLAERDNEIRALLAAHSDMKSDMERAQAHAASLEPIAQQAPKLESEIQNLQEALNDKDGQLMFLQERLTMLSSRLAAHQQRLAQLETLVTPSPEVEQKLAQKEAEIQSLAERHQSELSRIKVNSAQRLRRLRQSITRFY